jgi:hypothetical protein
MKTGKRVQKIYHIMYNGPAGEEIVSGQSQYSYLRREDAECVRKALPAGMPYEVGEFIRVRRWKTKRRKR